MRLQVVTSLFPSEPRPFEGIFAERRWSGMAARGHELRVLHPQPYAPWPLARGEWREISRMPAHERRAGLEVERPRYAHVPGWARSNAQRFAGRALSVIDKGPRPDAVVCDYAWPAAALAPGLGRRGVPCIVSGRGSDVLEVAGEAGLAQELAGYLAAATAWIAVSRDLVRAMDALAQGAGAGPAEGRAGVLVPNGVDTELFHPGSRDAARARLELAPDSPLVLVIGHLIARKDPELALASFQAGAPPSATLVFIGSGPLEEQLRAAATAAGLGERVHFVGQQEPAAIAEWLSAANAVLLTSRREGRPNVVLEALAAGRPVIATAAGGTAEILPAELLLESRDPREIGERLAGVLSHPPEPQSLRSRVLPLSWEASLTTLEGVLEAAVRDAKVSA